MIKLFKISESPLPTAQKIQMIIDIIGDSINLDLYHITGEQIVAGNMLHLKNFLQLLEALSETFVTDSREDVLTAPEQKLN